MNYISRDKSLNNHTAIRRLILDCLKPHQPPIYLIATEVSKVSSVTHVEIDSVEVDSETESLKVTIEGQNLNFEEIETRLNTIGVVVHSVDKVVASRMKTETDDY